MSNSFFEIMVTFNRQWMNAAAIMADMRHCNLARERQAEFLQMARESERHVAKIVWC